MVQFVMTQSVGRLARGQVITDLSLVASIRQTEFASLIEAVADGQPFPTLPTVDETYYLAYQNIDMTSVGPGKFYFDSSRAIFDSTSYTFDQAA